MKTMFSRGNAMKSAQTLFGLLTLWVWWDSSLKTQNKGNHMWLPQHSFLKMMEWRRCGPMLPSLFLSQLKSVCRERKRGNMFYKCFSGAHTSHGPSWKKESIIDYVYMHTNILVTDLTLGYSLIRGELFTLQRTSNTSIMFLYTWHPIVSST